MNDFNHLTLHIRKMLNITEMVEEEPDRVYTLDRKPFNAVAVAHPDVCVKMTKEQFEAMDDDVRNGMKPECVDKLPFLSELSREMIRGMNPKCFSRLSAESYGKVKDLLSEAQAKAVPASAKVTPAPVPAEAPAAPAEPAEPAAPAKEAPKDAKAK